MMAVFSTANAWLNGHKGLLVLVVAFFTALGFRIVSPRARLEELAGEIRTNRHVADSAIGENRRQADSTIAALGVRLTYTTAILEALAREQCLHAPRYETQLTGLPCSRLLQGMGR